MMEAPPKELLDYGFAIALAWWVIKDLIGIIKSRDRRTNTPKVDCDNRGATADIQDKVKDLHDWHNVRTRDGGFIWWDDGAKIENRLANIERLLTKERGNRD